ncbi:hypothetical protein niasHS_017730 [Heterodera schachtii]|uniref:Ribosome biogenesis protein BOP1 homolog n=1 Tax=Heterodera schachtii TaxID=97005 RepID=A0ABD2I0H5_HETSC
MEGSKSLQIDEYDTSDEEDLRNTIGNIPVQWYNDYDHVGYTLSGDKIKKDAIKTDEIDAFLQKEEDSDYWRKVFDRQSGQQIALTDQQVEKLNAIADNRFPEIGYNPYPPFLDIFSSVREIHPISNRPPDKRSFVPSADERRIVGRMVHAIKMGWLKRKEPPKGSEEEEEPRLYDLWDDEGDEQRKSKSQMARVRMHLPAPKVKPPEHAESYNPPPEYLFDEDERRKWEETEPEKRRVDFVPHKFDALRMVPFYDKFYDERIERCMDLYLAPRQRKMRLNVDPKQLLPDLPNPKDLQPFPTTLAFYLRGHSGQVRTLAVEPEIGELLVSGGADSTVRVWLLPSGKCLRLFEMPASVTCVAFCPNSNRTLTLVSCESDLVTVLNIQSGDRLAVSNTRQFIAGIPFGTENTAGVLWTHIHSKTMNGIRIKMNDKIRSLCWHKSGDYFATVGFENAAGTVVIHQLSKCNSQKPFTKRKGFVQCVLFHPNKPFFFVGTRQHILIYDLAKCELTRQLSAGTKWLSSMQLHRGGDNLFVGGLDRTFAWLDLELSSKPWKKLRNHQSAIRSLACHGLFPLVATVSDDATAIVYHARVSTDLMGDNELVPVKRLFGHKFFAKRELDKLRRTTKLEEGGGENSADGEKPHAEGEDDEGADGGAGMALTMSNDRLAILCAVFHPTQPWLLTSGADGQIALFTY